MNKVTHCKRCISGITIVRLKVGNDNKLIYDVDCDDLVGSLFVTKSGTGSIWQNLFNRANLSSDAIGEICDRVATAARLNMQAYIDDLINQGIEPPEAGSTICVTFDLGSEAVCYQITQDWSTGFKDVTQLNGASPIFTTIPCP